MEKVLLIISLVLIVASLGLSVVNIVMSRKKKGGGENVNLTEDIENLNNNLNEVKNLINEHTSAQSDKLLSSTTNAIKASNDALIPMLEMYMNNFQNTLNNNLQSSNNMLKEIRQEMKSATDDMSKGTRQALVDLKRDMQESLEKMDRSMRESIDKIDKSIRESIDKIGESIKQSLKEVRDDNASQLARVRENNESQLEKMRQTVDEKLSETLDKRVKSAFETVNTSLMQVQQGLGEMKDLTGKVTNLNKMFANVKTRGNWGEVALESLLTQILSPEQYKTQFRLENKANREMVDFAIVMPGQSGEVVYLPIDSKFPLDKYITLVEVSESGDTDKIEIAKKELSNAVKEQAKSISKKYIIQGVTTRFAVMYLPSEALYAEIVKDSALTSIIQNQYNVTICGPTTITALLNSLQMGFATLKIQKQSGEIAKALQSFQKDFEKYTGLVTKVKGHAEQVVKDINDMEDRNRKINTRLAKASGNLPQEEDTKLIAADTTDDDGEGE